MSTHTSNILTNSINIESSDQITLSNLSDKKSSSARLLNLLSSPIYPDQLDFGEINSTKPVTLSERYKKVGKRPELSKNFLGWGQIQSEKNQQKFDFY